MRLLVVDGYSLMYRAFYAIPPLTAPGRRPSNALFGFFSMIIKLLDDYQPDAFAVALDMPGPTFRHELYPQYKAGRKETPEELRGQLRALRPLLEALRIAYVGVPGFEGDDVLGTLSQQAEEQGWETLLVTGDRDALQLIAPNTQVLLTKRGISDIVRMDAEALVALWGIAPERVPDLKGLMGDSSDNIPGIPRVGEKTAVKLLAEFGSLDAVLENAASIPGKLGENVRANQESALLSRKLARIDRDAPVRFDPEAFRVPDLRDGRAYEPFAEWEFHKLIARLGGDASDIPRTPSRMPAEMDAAALRADKAALPAWRGERELESLEELRALSWDAEAGVALHIEQNTLTLATERGARYRVPIRGDLATPGFDMGETLEALSTLLESPCPKVFVDAKRWLSDARVCGSLWDAHVASFLIDSTNAGTTLANIAGQMGMEVVREDAALLWEAQLRQKRRIAADGLQPLYDTIEGPLIQVLSDMERVGFRIDAGKLREIGVVLDAQAEALRAEVCEQAGMEFNLNSTKQLQAVLFEKLGLETGKMTKGKTGFSTNAETLEPLAEKYPIVANLLEYRHIVKLKGTYIDGLILAADGDGRVHSTLHQTGAVTGRISSSEPNLQNIPIRTQQGRVIRGAFVAQPGWVLVDADYSQIELRVLAHMSGDAALIEAFTQGQDIHTRTASEVFGVPMDQVTAEMRSSAKAVNFGIVYGISGYGLSKGIGASRADAQQYIDTYFERYPGVRRYMELQKELGKERGYVETLFGRRRYLPEMQSQNHTQRSFGERAAMNTPIQGTAADIIKLAMVRVHAALAARKGEARLILQVHDELIVEAPEAEAKDVAALLEREMVNVIQLDAPLEADVGIGTNWLDAK